MTALQEKLWILFHHHSEEFLLKEFVAVFLLQRRGLREWLPFKTDVAEVVLVIEGPEDFLNEPVSLLVIEDAAELCVDDEADAAPENVMVAEVLVDCRVILLLLLLLLLLRRPW